MPSYRLLVDVLDVLPGHAPPEVAEALVAGVREHAFVSAQDLDIVRGVPRLRVRFEVPDGGAAEETAAALLAGEAGLTAVRAVARVVSPRLLRRTPRNRWLAVSAPGWGR